MTIKHYLTTGLLTLVVGTSLLLLWFVGLTGQPALFFLSLILIPLGLTTFIYAIIFYILRKKPLSYKKFLFAGLGAIFTTILAMRILASPLFNLISTPNPEYLNNLAKDTDRVCLNPKVDFVIRNKACTHSDLTRKSTDVYLNNDIDAKLFSDLELDLYIFGTSDRKDAQAMLAYKGRYLGHVSLTGMTQEYQAHIMENEKYVSITLANNESLKTFVLNKENFEIYETDTLDFKYKYSRKALLRTKLDASSEKITVDIQEYNSTQVQKYEFDIKQKRISLEKGS